MTVEQSECRVNLYTKHHRIEGMLILLKGEKLSDKLNMPGHQFESILSARVYSVTTGQLLHESPFLAVNKDHVTVMIPVMD